jgi:glycosyltransferase involved in cell wall biosynthesis
MPLDVCICTHNPNQEVLAISLKAIANQTLSKDDYQVWIIDNASEPPISDRDLDILTQAGVTYQLLREPRLGTMYARELASQVIPGDAIVLVDDDNELLPDYLEVAVAILAQHPEIGYFGGKLLSGIKVAYPNWMEQLLPYLGIKDEGNEPISKYIEGEYYWGKWEPPCAGAVIRKVVLQRYFENLQRLAPNVAIGRQGKQGLLSMADSWLASCTYELGLACSYQPRLQLIHHINPERLKFEYFLRLLYNYGRSDVILRRILDRQINVNEIESIHEKVQWWENGDISVGYLVCLLAVEAGFSNELDRDHPVDVITILDQYFSDKSAKSRQELIDTQNGLVAAQSELISTQQALNAAHAQIKSMEQTKLWRVRKALSRLK